MNGIKKNRGRDKPTKKGRSQRTRDGEKSSVNSGGSQSVTLSSQIKSALFTNCGMYQSDTTKMIGLYNQ